LARDERPQAIDAAAQRELDADLLGHGVVEHGALEGGDDRALRRAGAGGRRGRGGGGGDDERQDERRRGGAATSPALVHGQHSIGEGAVPEYARARGSAPVLRVEVAFEATAPSGALRIAW
jgi:hypothetical protein